MKCLICNSVMFYHFSKRFDVYTLTNVDYHTCSNCGFTISKTHAEMPSDKWESLNYEYHKSYQGQTKATNPDDPRWVERLKTQADVFFDASRLGLIKTDGRWLDYACGDGKLSSFLKGTYGLTLLKHDRYMLQNDDYLLDKDLKPRAYDMVVTTSVFEHFTQREQFDAVEALVSQKGVLSIHTMVCESIPCDDSWFYLLPVHCAFHTNKSMGLLFKQWGYHCSVYNVDARLWLWFKESELDVQTIVEDANKRYSNPKYIYKKDFVDYWK